jgi:iron(III) transport system substrate-binding protein
MRGKAFLLAVLAVVIPSALQAAEQASPWLEGAKKEGKFLWYTTTQPASTDVIMKRFRERFPFIDISVYSANSAKVQERFVNEARNNRNQADLIKTSDIHVEELLLEEAKLLQKYSSPEARAYPSEMRDPAGYWNTLELGTNGIIYSPRLVPKDQVPSSYADLLQPRWKGKMGMDNRDEEWFAAMLQIMGEAKGLEYMKRLAQQDVNVRNGTTVLQNMVIAGEFPVLVNGRANTVEALIKKGAPIDWIAVEPVHTTVSVVAIPAQAPHPNAAKLFIDWILSVDGQQVQKEAVRIPARPGIYPDPPRLIKDHKLHVLDGKDMAKNYNRYTTLFRQIFIKKK